MSTEKTPVAFYGAREAKSRLHQRFYSRSRLPASDSPSALPFQPRESLFERADRRLTQLHEASSEEEESTFADGFEQRRSTPLSFAGGSRAPLRDCTQSPYVDPKETAPRKSSIVSMLQTQQQLLQTVLDQQTEMKTQHSQFCEKLCKLESEIHDLKSKSSSSSSSAGSTPQKAKVRVTRDLSNKVSAVHDNLEEGFNADESSTTHHNQQVKRKIVKEIVDTPGCSYSEIETGAAVKRKYEGLRKRWKDEQKENFEELQHSLNQRKKYRARRLRKYTNRSDMVLDSETKYWKNLGLEYMSEESALMQML